MSTKTDPEPAGSEVPSDDAPSSDAPGDNEEVQALMTADQADREVDTDDWGPIAARDRQRRARILEIDQAGGLRTANDLVAAALIFQHGEVPADYERAHGYADAARSLDPAHPLASWLWAATKDRWLHSQGKPQIYGTQYRMGEDGRFSLEPIDRGAVSDDERASLGVPSLAESEARAAALDDAEE